MRWVRRRRASEPRPQPPHLTIVPASAPDGEEHSYVREPRLVIDPLTVWIVADDGSVETVFEARP